MDTGLSAPIGILDEHPDWSTRLTLELTRRGLPWEKIDHSSHAFDPRARRPAYSVIVNRSSPSSHTREHACVLFYTEAFLAHVESLGIPVINPDVGGSGAGIVRFTTREELADRLDSLHFGPDGTALVQEYIESDEGAIVRVEVLDGRYLYAIRIVRDRDAGFNLCPADICQTAPAPSAVPAAADLGACPVDAKPGLDVRGYEAPAEAIDTVIRLTRAASIDVGGVEYLVSKADGKRYYYDVNATSNFVANAPAVVGFEPTERFVDYIVDVARRGGRPGRGASPGRRVPCRS